MVMYIRSLEVLNFRCFKKGQNNFVFPSDSQEQAKGVVPNVNLLLGMNGAGKTTLLKAIALAVLAPVIQSSGYKPHYLVRRQGKRKRKPEASVKAELVLHGQDLQTRQNGEIATSSPSATISARGSYETIIPSRRIAHVEQIFDDKSHAYFMVGYGATRRVESVENLSAEAAKRRGLRYLRVAGLFEEYITLFPLGAWLPRVKTSFKERYAEIAKAFKNLLPIDTELTGKFEELEPIFRHKGVDLPFGALSDGYRAYIGLIGDLLYHLQLTCPKRTKLTHTTGIVLVDDIDLHLHPSWQRTVVPSLARTFPKLQFILTSHSPIVVGTLHARNLRIVEDATVKQLEERVHGLSADQILTSSYFNLTTTRSPDEETRLTELTEEVAERSDPDGAIAFLRRLAGKED
jgi:predicted ATPase